jgi:exopolysaccharide biosynthesis protein
VKIQHPSQLRRFLADGQYGSPRQYLTSQMAASVNAVVASAGDFYKYRSGGFVVMDGQVHRFNPHYMDVCFVDDQGDLSFHKDSEFPTQEDLQKHVDDNNIRFSLSFGPTLIQDGVRYDTWSYPVGEVTGNFSRAAICQLGPLHYLLVTVNSEGMNYNYPTIHSFSKALFDLGIPNAYALDGGQTATIVMNDQVINQVNYGAERYISDIVYFATALPET